ncbi:hypothetical protein JHK82_033237 [Glycine max]|nr:hypothetical protein JHK85_033959 [Glycine max]KAG4985635.1 hypothetical protein JHK86_033326 [Glycine max]KAG5118817.1 hypothetical protein JHK82_033237 [Glycine max]KAG5139808.1 hypothetical protein JHK84_033576 [Glycine max]
MATVSAVSAPIRRLEGKVAIITGGASGIGEATARLFSKHGAHVVIADIQDDLGLSLCKHLESASYVHCDVTKEEDVENCVNTAVSKYGKLDIMLNNAGICDEIKTSILDNNKSDFESVISVNLVGPFLGTKHAARVMIAAKRGSIINTASVAGTLGGVATHAYTSSKHALIGLMKSTAVELGQFGIRVNCVSPYVVPTPLTKKHANIDEEGVREIYSNLKGVHLVPNDVAEAALYLAGGVEELIVEVLREGKEAKVEDLEVVDVTQEEVLMGDVVAVAKTECEDKLLKVEMSEGNGVWEAVVAGNLKKSLSSPTKSMMILAASLSSRLMGSVPLASAAALARRLEGKVALITGGASGIGECTARLFSKHGAKVVIADIQDELGHSICKDLDSSSATYIHCDVTKEENIEHAVNTTVSKYGKLDIMHSSAGIVGAWNPSILHNKKSHFEQVISVNLVGTFLGIKHAARVMIPSGRGSIVAMASICGRIGGVASHAYTSSKHGIVGLVRNTAVELGTLGIRVNSVSPYAVPTPMSKTFLNTDDEGIAALYSNLKGTVLKPQDVAEAVLYLGSDESKYVSGHDLVVDGGFTVVNPGLCVFGQSV